MPSQWRRYMSSSMRNPERAHDPTSRTRHAHEHPCAQSRGERRSHARDTAHRPRAALVPDRASAGQAGRRSAQVCARDWRRPAGGGGSGSFLRTTDWIRGRAGLGSKEGFKRYHGRRFRLPHRPARVGRTSLPELPHRDVVANRGRTLRRASPPCAHGTGRVKDSGRRARGEAGA